MSDPIVAPEQPEQPAGSSHELFEDESVEDARVVRPYALTRGRTRPGRADLPLEALVRGVAGTSDTTSSAGTPERRRILDLAVHAFGERYPVEVHQQWLKVFLERMEHMELAGPTPWFAANMVTRIEHMPVKYRFKH